MATFGRGGWCAVLAALSLALPLIATSPAAAEPAGAEPAGAEPAGAPAASGPTDPASLVNDPAADATRFDHSQDSVSLTVAGPNLVAAYNDDGSSTGPDDLHFTGYSVSGDGGRSWTDRGAVNDSPLPDFGSPSLATDQQSGRVYLATEGRDDGKRSLLVFRSDDDGQTFGDPVVTARATTFGPAPLLPDVAVDNFPGPGQGRVYLGYNDLFGLDDGIKLRVSEDGGATWGPAGGVPVDKAVQQPSRPDLVVTPDHCLHVVYLRTELGFTTNSIEVRTSCDGGQTFAPRVRLAELSTGNSYGDLRINGNFRSNSFPQAAVNPVSGTMYVVYNDLTEDRGAEVFLTTSTGGAASWTPPAVVNSDRSASDQFSPTVAVTGDGSRLMVGFYDRRADPFNLHIQRWGRLGLINPSTGALRLLPDSQLGPAFPPVRPDSINEDDALSDFEAMTADDSTIYAAWTDNRDGDAFSPFQSDIRSATVPTRGGSTDLAVRVSADPEGPVALGQQYRYTATITNTSSRPAVNVFARTQLPPGVRFDLVTTNGAGPCYRLGRDVSCRLGILAAGASRTVSVVAQALQAGPLPRTVSATSTTQETRRTNNAASAPTIVTAAPTATDTYSSGSIASPIPRPGARPTYVPIAVPAGAGISLDLDVLLRANHGDVSSLDIALIAPDRTTVALSSNNGFSYARNYGTGPNDCTGAPTVLDDAQETSVVDGEAPFAGPFRPEGELSDALGTAYTGVWYLRIVDQDPLVRGGTVGCVQLRFTHTR